MSLYTKTTNFAAKDSLASGDPNKIVKGSELGAEFDAIQAGFTGTMALDGSQVPTANLPMGGFKLTGLAAGSAATDSATIGGTETLSNKTATNPGNTDQT